MLTGFALWFRNTVHDAIRGYLLVPTNSDAYSTAPRDIALNTIFFAGAVFAPLYYCILRDVMNKIRSYKYKIVKTPDQISAAGNSNLNTNTNVQTTTTNPNASSNPNATGISNAESNDNENTNDSVFADTYPRINVPQRVQRQHSS